MTIRPSAFRPSRTLTAALMLGITFVAALALASEPGADGFFQTGVTVKRGPRGPEYTVLHEMKSLPKTRSALGIVSADVSKRFLITPAKDLSCDSFKTLLRVGLLRNGMSPTAATSLVSACSGVTIRARSPIAIVYSPGSQTTTLTIEKMGTTQVSGLPAMRSVWGIWFGNPESAKEKSALSARL